MLPIYKVRFFIDTLWCIDNDSVDISRSVLFRDCEIFEYFVRSIWDMDLSCVSMYYVNLTYFQASWVANIIYIKLYILDRRKTRTFQMYVFFFYIKPFKYLISTIYRL